MAQLENTNFHLLLGENWSGWSRVDQKPPKSKSVSKTASSYEHGPSTTPHATRTPRTAEPIYVYVY